jgi:hypothetical protein
VILHDAHQSGRFDASLAERRAMLAQISTRAWLGGVTEGVGLDMLPGWRAIGHESKVVWNNHDFILEDHQQVAIPTPPWRRGSMQMNSVTLQAALLRIHRSAKVLRVVGHLPAHLYDPRQLRANRAALAGMTHALRPLIREWQPTLTNVSLDLNRDLRRLPQREIVQQAFLHLSLHLVVPPKGTHHRRKIDAFLTSSAMHEATMLDRISGFDHRGIRLRVSV